MKSRKSYEEEARTLLSDLFHQIKELEEKACKTRNQLADDVEEQIRKLKENNGKLYLEYKKLKSSGNEALTDLYQGFETALDALSEAFRKATTHFK